jgi:hypothetical protein
MIGDQVRCYIVSVSMEDDDPIVFGPYTKRKAHELADTFNARVEAGLFTDREFGWIHAGAQRIDNPQSVKGMLHEFGK